MYLLPLTDKLKEKIEQAEMGSEILQDHFNYEHEDLNQLADDVEEYFEITDKIYGRK